MREIPKYLADRSIRVMRQEHEKLGFNNIWGKRGNNNSSGSKGRMYSETERVSGINKYVSEY